MIRLAIVLLAAVLAGCATAPPPGAGEAAPGAITIRVARTDHLFVGSHQEVRVVAPDGTIVAGTAVPVDGPTTLTVPGGDWTLEAFTVFVSDFGQCVPDPTASGGTRCFLPTLEPTSFCRLPVTVPARGSIAATLTILENGCQLEIAAASGPPAS